jgi:hypothetical protein
LHSADQVVDDDPNIISWDGDHDVENPLNWPLSRKFLNCGLVCAMAFIAPLASCTSF